VKCNSDPILLKYLASLNTGFDCASIEEMRIILDLGVQSDRILFASPCKSQSSLVFARKAGILRMTFDNIDKLDSIRAHMPEAQLLLRVYANDDTALIPLGNKYGAHLDTVRILLARVKELGLNLVGVSFHVGRIKNRLNSSPGVCQCAKIVTNRYWSK
jgi:ornithine decarboxylase